jgi:hypothetical protein
MPADTLSYKPPKISPEKTQKTTGKRSLIWRPWRVMTSLSSKSYSLRERHRATIRDKPLSAAASVPRN